MLAIHAENVKTWNTKMRPMFGRIIKELAKTRPEIMLVVADSARACGLAGGFPDAPAQFIDCGIAEQNMIGVAAGLARCGKRPVVFAFAPFTSERGFEQIRVDIAYSNLPVVLIGSEGGVGMGTQGVTHFGWEDVAVMRSLPNMTVICPADNAELVKCMHAALAADGPVYVRMNGGVPKPVYQEDYTFEVGKAITLRRGDAATIIATGTPVATALAAAEALGRDGIDCEVVNMHTVKPLDEDAVLAATRRAPAIVTIEEHSVVNGLGSAVADVLAASGLGCRLIKMGLPDAYPATVSPYPDLLKRYGLTADDVAATVRNAARRTVAAR